LGKCKDKSSDSQHPAKQDKKLLQLRPPPCFLFYGGEEANIGEVYLLVFSKVKEMDQDGNRKGNQAEQENRICENHQILGLCKVQK
jgi:hypothetical protein